MKTGVVARMRAGIASMFKAQPVLSGVDSSRGWLTLGDWQTGAWQRDDEICQSKVLANWALFSCMTLIASDISKITICLRQKKGQIWEDADSPSFSPVLQKPNRYQTRQQFIECWALSKLSRGNTYVLKERDQRGVVVALHVLYPDRVQTLIAENGEVFYQLIRDDLANLRGDYPAVPASEIIHDRFNCLFHPLVGLSSIYANGLAAIQGLKIQENSSKFFGNMSRPSGILSAPGAISNETAQRLKSSWEDNYTGDKVGKVAVLGDDLKYQALGITAVDSQMVEQLKFSGEMICSTMHVPPFKIGLGTIPGGAKIDDLNQIYFTDCLHTLTDAIKTLLTEGLGLDTPKEGKQYGVFFDMDDLFRLDTATMTQVLRDQVQGGIRSPNEAREKLNLPPVEGGESPMAQQQQFSLAALAKRDAQADPFSTGTPPAPANDAPMSQEEMDAEMEAA